MTGAADIETPPTATAAPLHGIWRATAKALEPGAMTRAALLGTVPAGQAYKTANAVLEMWDAGLIKFRRGDKLIELSDLGRQRLIASGFLISTPARFTVDPQSRVLAVRCSCGWNTSVEAFQAYTDPEIEVRIVCANHARDAHAPA
jgi:hypothetical protein